MKNYYSKILRILFKRFFIFSVCIFLNHASTLHAEEINVLNLISQGKGIQAQNIIQKDIENASGIKKISLINDLLDFGIIVINHGNTFKKLFHNTSCFKSRLRRMRFQG
jgi:hypothetical protein